MAMNNGIEGLLDNLRDHNYDVQEGIAPAEHRHETVRKFEHAGHHIEIQTRYEISVDGRPFSGPLHVLDDGAVHYHGLPQYSTASAVELVKLIVDILLEGDPPPPIGEGDEHHNHDHHLAPEAEGH